MKHLQQRCQTARAVSRGEPWVELNEQDQRFAHCAQKLLRRALASAMLCTIDEMHISSMYRYTTSKTTSSESPST
eukprot:1773842-Pleurochrysis_carterae.AAC.1